MAVTNVVVTLTTIPPRFAELSATLRSLLNQSTSPGAIQVYVPQAYRRFPDWDGALPEVPSGVEIVRIDEDFGPATKVLPACLAFKGTETEILFCDDDRDYPPDWVKRFLAAREAVKDAAITLNGFNTSRETGHPGPRDWTPRAVRRLRVTDFRFQAEFLWRQLRAGRNWHNVVAPERCVFKRSGYIDVFEGFGGVLVRPGMFDAAAFEIPPILWTVDDVWLSGQPARRNIPIWLDANRRDPDPTRADAKAPLAGATIDGANRAAANLAAIRHLQQTYGIWPEN